MSYRFGIEEEFFVVCDKTAELKSQADEEFLARAKQLSGGAVKRELLQSQIETATPVCSSFAEARSELVRLRSAIVEAGNEYDRSIVAAGTHPTAVWSLQERSVKPRYDTIVAELQMLAQRNLVCGLHVHVELPDPELQISVMRRSLPFLPILLALSTSSPFWQGRRTGFAGYRLTSYDEMPRAGLPPLFSGWAEYQAYVDALQDAGVISDASYIWWAIRPSSKFPTLELRIADACTSVEDALTIAALYRCLVRRLVEHRTLNASMTAVGRALAKENKWRAQRFGIKAELINPFPGAASSISVAAAARLLVEMLQPDARALNCRAEIERVETILSDGTSADAQVGIYEQALTAGASEEVALQGVLSWLRQETSAGCGSNSLERLH